VPVFVVRNLRFGSTPDESAVVGFALAFGFTLVARFDFDRYDHASLYKPGLGTWLVVAAGLGLAVASVSAARAVPRDPADAASPRAVLAHDRSAALVLGLAVLLAAGVVVGIEAINRARDRDRVLGQNSGTGP
jgi:hypothetical protein